MTVDVKTPSDLEIAVTRIFDAPARMVFDAHTKPEIVQRWMLGPPGWSMPVCEIDLRVGGRYRHVWRNDASGQQFAATGEFKEIAQPTRIVHSEAMEGCIGDSWVTLTLIENNGRTTLTTLMRFLSKEIRDAALASGMADGMGASYDRLEQFVFKQAA